MEEIIGGMPDEQKVLDLGIMLGQRRAFGMVAGRCSAAQAECLRKVRDEKTYLKFAANWAGFCERQLKIGKRTADRAIARSCPRRRTRRLWPLMAESGVVDVSRPLLTSNGPSGIDPA